MIGVVRLKEQKPELQQHSFEDLKVGEGIQSNHKDGIRIKTTYNAYLHFQRTGDVVSNESHFWPHAELRGNIRRFQLIAEEI